MGLWAGSTGESLTALWRLMPRTPQRAVPCRVQQPSNQVFSWSVQLSDEWAAVLQGEISSRLLVSVCLTLSPLFQTPLEVSPRFVFFVLHTSTRRGGGEGAGTQVCSLKNRQAYPPAAPPPSLNDVVSSMDCLACATSCLRSVFAYGQTSTGKTHTMQGTEDQPGVIPLAIEECFSYVSTSNDDRYIRMYIHACV